MQITPMSAFGYEITDVDLAAASGEELGEVKAAFADAGLIVVRGQTLSEAQHIAFAERYGEINVNRFFTAHPAYRKIALVTKEPDQQMNIGLHWHTDHSYVETPALGSMLLAKELPPRGGDTCFASMYSLYDRLSPGLQRTLEGMNAVHSAKHVFGTMNKPVVVDAMVKGSEGDRIGNASAADALPDPVHPVVIRHPLSGKKSLYINPQFTLHFEGWTPEESRPLMDYLFELGKSENEMCRVEWRAGTMTFWDNRATWHSAMNDYHGFRRHMHRITIEGCALEAAVGGVFEGAFDEDCAMSGA
jgi:taurine dioxygenase